MPIVLHTPHPRRPLDDAIDAVIADGRHQGLDQDLIDARVTEVARGMIYKALAESQTLRDAAYALGITRRQLRTRMRWYEIDYTPRRGRPPRRRGGGGGDR